MSPRPASVRDVRTTSELVAVGETPTPTDDGSPALVLVEWHDAWFDFDLLGVDERRPDYLVRTVGFLVAEDPRFISLAQEVLPEGEGFRAVTHIPVAIVERIQALAPTLRV
jgi:hypothetical protein